MSEQIERCPVCGGECHIQHEIHKEDSFVLCGDKGGCSMCGPSGDDSGEKWNRLARLVRAAREAFPMMSAYNASHPRWRACEWLCKYRADLAQDQPAKPAERPLADQPRKLRPYRDAAEFAQAMREHGNYISQRAIMAWSIGGIWLVVPGETGNVEWVTYADLASNQTWQDGEPCGVEE